MNDMCVTAVNGGRLHVLHMFVSLRGQRLTSLHVSVSKGLATLGFSCMIVVYARGS